MLKPYIENFVLERVDSIMIAPPIEISIPPLRTYVFVPVTGRVIARTLMPGERKADKEEKVHQIGKKAEKKTEKGQKAKEGGGKGSIFGNEVVQPGPPKGDISADMEVDGESPNQSDDEGEDSDAGEEEAEIARLEKQALEKQSQTKRKKKDGKEKEEGKKKKKA